MLLLYILLLLLVIEFLNLQRIFFSERDEKLRLFIVITSNDFLVFSENKKLFMHLQLVKKEYQEMTLFSLHIFVTSMYCYSNVL